MTLPASAYGPPTIQVDMKPGCWRCGRTLAGYVGRPWSIRCRRCGAPNNRGDAPST